MKKLPIGIQSFSELINGGYTYVDKTELIFNLLQNKTYFLSRPRRFGKSLLVSTLKELFLGNKEIFKGLWIYEKHEFKKHPVIHLDMSAIPFQEQGLKEALNKYFINYAEGIKYTLRATDYSEMFPELIKHLSKEGKVVILIDEYDKPIIHDLSNNEYACAQRDILKTLFAPLKSLDEYIQFLFLTGVSKFSMVSIFSDLNHLKDITLNEDFATIVGLTETELINSFSEYITTISSKYNISPEVLMERMRKMYNGYCFHQNALSVYNPFSILNFFSEREFKNYWFSTGTPTFLVEVLKNRDIDIVNELPKEIGRDFNNKLDLSSYAKIEIWTLLFQTGYLTIKGFDEEYDLYQLNFPNNEVKNAFMQNILEVYSYETNSTVSSSVGIINRALAQNDWKTIIEHINILFASIPHLIFQPKSEFYYHSIIHTIISLCGTDIQSEVQTSTGRIDCVIKNKNYIFIVEFKIGTAETALQQIEQNEYFASFKNDTRPVFMVGVGFDLDKKAIGSWLSKKVV